MELFIAPIVVSIVVGLFLRYHSIPLQKLFLWRKGYKERVYKIKFKRLRMWEWGVIDREGKEVRTYNRVDHKHPYRHARSYSKKLNDKEKFKTISI